MSGIKGKSGPPGNQNAIGNPGGTGRPPAHGLTGWLKNARLPKGADYIRRRLAGFQTALEQGVLVRTGEIGLYASATIQSCCRHEGRVQLLQRYLRQTPEMELSDRLAVLRDISAATEKRDGCLEKLGLDSAAEDSWQWPTAASVMPPDAPEPIPAPEAIYDASTPPAVTEKPTIDSMTLEGN